MTKPTASQRESALAQQIVTQGRCYRLLFKCAAMRKDHPNTAACIAFDKFTEEGMVCARHPHLPPHYQSPPPSFFSQSLIGINAADAISQLSWFEGQFAPYPDPIPLGAPQRSPTSEPAAPGTSAQGTATAVKRRPAPPAKGVFQKRKRASATQSASNAPDVPITYAQGFHSGADTGSDDEINHVDYIVSHHHNTAFKGSGANTQLCYTIKWVGHDQPSGDLFDHAAICRLNPSYWNAYA